MPRILLLMSLALLSTTAIADDRRCEHAAPRSLALDYTGVKTVAFEIGHNAVRIDATRSPQGRVEGQACASGAALLDQLTLTQERKGDKLVVRALRDGARGLSLGTHYAYMTLQAGVPDDVMLQLNVGSGDAWVTGAQALSIDLGSGDVDARRIAGKVTAKVGSGDIELEDIGALHVLSIGSGDVSARNVRGQTEVGSIGSGDFSLEQGGGDVRIGSIGSGDAEIEHITGNVSVGSIGSGGLEVSRISGNLGVRSKGSGDISHSAVGGTVDVPRRR